MAIAVDEPVEADTSASDDAVAGLLALSGYRVAPDMHRWLWLRERVAAEGWLAEIDAIRVTGSNGKGSTCVMLDAVMRALGVTTGRITSPHFFRFHERISADGAPISAPEFSRVFRWARAQAGEYLAEFGSDLNSYETMVAMALRYFADRRPELVISEAGKGGRYDPGWVFPSTLAAITSVDLEHTRELGGSLLEILCHKADLCSPGGALIVGGLAAPLDRQLAAYASMRAYELIDLRDVARWRIRRQRADGMLVDLSVDGLDFTELSLGLVGEHQASNAAIALTLARRWLARQRPALDPSALVEAARASLGALRFPGRFSRIHDAPLVHVDVAHTADGARALAAALAASPQSSPVLLVLGLSAHRAPEDILRPLAPLVRELVVTKPCAGDRPHEPDALADAARRVAPRMPVRCEVELVDATRYALSRAREQGMQVLAVGGHAICSELAEAVCGRDPGALRRFGWLR
ncbi:MAG: Mur ligase family protein [Nannocystaceae bacterium]